MSWADEYRAGDHEGVWRELTELGPGLRREVDDLHDTAFIGYLRSALLDWGGFHGWARREPAWAAPTDAWPLLLAHLTVQFERF